MNGMLYTQHMNDRASEGDWAPQLLSSLKGSVQVLEKIKLSWES